MAALVYYGFRMRPDDIVYDCLPLYHSAGNRGRPPSLLCSGASGSPPLLVGSILWLEARELWSQIWVQIQMWPLTGPLNERRPYQFHSVCGCVPQDARTGPAWQFVSSGVHSLAAWEGQHRDGIVYSCSQGA